MNVSFKVGKYSVILFHRNGGGVGIQVFDDDNNREEATLDERELILAIKLVAGRFFDE